MSRAPSIRARPRPPLAGQLEVSGPPPTIAEAVVAVSSSGADKPVYAVGYGKPPVATRFGGPRGNRSGRKKGSRTRRAIIQEELDAKVDVPGHGKLSKYQLSVRQLANQAAKGDLKAVAAVLRLALDQEREAREQERLLADQPAEATFDAADHGVIDILEDLVREAASVALANTDKGRHHD